MKKQQIVLQNVRVHNLQGIDLTLQKNELILFTGVSGSGKSSLAFDTLYVEGQRRYVESLSQHARRQLGDMNKPDIEHASGISPTISIEQKTAGRNPRSTVGTLTEIYDYLRVLFARVGVAHCPVSGEIVVPQSKEKIIKTVQNFPEGSKILILSPYARNKKGEFKEDFQDLLKKGYLRANVDGNILELGEAIELDRQSAHDVDVVIDRLIIKKEEGTRIAESVTQALEFSQGSCLVFFSDTKEEMLFSMHAYSPKSGISYPALEPQDFSFNSPIGMCERCQGLGVINEFNLSEIIDPDKSISEDTCFIASSYQTVRYGNIYDNLARLYDFSVKTPWKKLSENAKNIFLYGNEKKWTRMHFIHPVTGAEWTDNIGWKGVLKEAHQRYTEAKSDSYRKKMEQWMSEQICPGCQGMRLKPYPSACLFQGKSIHEITKMTIEECLTFFKKVNLPPLEFTIAAELLKEIQERLTFLEKVGLHYLALDRSSPTLSGGEAQRVRLAAQIGSGLVGITYVLDEPSIGLHPRDNLKLIETLTRLKNLGNTVIVVEHDEDTILAADYIVDFGPGAGSRGGRIVAKGSLDEVIENPNSITASYLIGKKIIEIPKKRKKIKFTPSHTLTLVGAKHHNLKNIDVKIPLNAFVAITGVSGSGKSSLISEILAPSLTNLLHQAEKKVGEHTKIEGVNNLDKVITIDQSPIGRNPRSNPATYIKLFDEIRDLFCKLPESRARGYLPGRFSFNVHEGTCPVCKGMGMVKVDMDFMEDEWVECSLCHGKRFDSETLSVFYKGKNIYDILEMEVGEALEFFSSLPSIKKKLQTLQEVGMDYIKLGQSSTTLSGGEAQRIKLAKELTRPSTGKTLYILDEPTTGLHYHDINYLLKVLKTLVDKGNTVIVIEHNMEVVKTTDWVIDLGPDGGKEGGEVVASCPPEELATMNTPTGKALKAVLYPSFEERKKEILKKKKQENKKEKEEHLLTIDIEEAEQNNLKRVTVSIPREKISLFTGPSGSGKTSLALDTLYAEGQRRYIESLSPYARQFVKQMAKPKVGRIEGLSPAIAIEQKTHAANPRSTVGTMTEIYDYLRLLYAHKGVPHCPETGEVIKSISKDSVVEKLLSEKEGEKIQILAPLNVKKNQSISDLIEKYRRQGFLRFILNDESFDLDEEEEKIKKAFDPKRKNELFLIVDRLVLHPSIAARLSEAVETASKIGEGKITVLKNNQKIFYNLSFSVESTGKSYPPITPQTFAFNTKEGMCLDCQGLGFQYGADLATHRNWKYLSLETLILQLWQEKATKQALLLFNKFLKDQDIPKNVPFHSLTQKQQNLVMNGSNTLEPISLGSLKLRWLGINTVFAKAGKSSKNDLKDMLIPLLEEHVCPSCGGAKLNPLARHVTIHEIPIHEFCSFPIEKAIDFLKKILLEKKEKKILEEVKSQIEKRLTFLIDVGLDYLSLSRRAPTLSGGETQRIRLARQLGSGLTGLLYVLDEPTIGLHPKDNDQINQALLKLKNLGNTLVLVEHDPLTIEKADYLLDFGPKAGELGGEITAKGTLDEIKKNPHSLTGAYLTHKKSIPFPKKYRALNKGKISIKNASLHNLKNISLSFPIGALSIVTGVSGSGKSTLVQKILLQALEKAGYQKDQVEVEGTTITGLSHFEKWLSINQNPIGLTARSDVGTYADILPRIRDFYSSLKEAKIHGLLPGHFSYNHRRGMCTKCWGMGYRKIEMHFLPPVQVICDECNGLRLNPLSLQVTYKGKNFGELLTMTIDEAQKFFENHPRITRILDTLIQVGLGYLRLGQEMASLSGGEAQRIKLSKELSKRSSGKTLYLLDEPTTGLHFSDIEQLLKVLHRLVDKGNTMIIIEHNLDMIKNADYVVDLGPGAGEKGGEVVASGRVTEIMKEKKSWTGQYLLKETSL